LQYSTAVLNVQVASARVSAIVHATEDLGKVIFALNQVCSQEVFQPRIEKKVLKGHFGNEIITVTLSLSSRSAESLLTNLWSNLPSKDRDTVLGELNSRLDEEDRLHLRLDKQQCFRGTLRLNDQDAIKVHVCFRKMSDSMEQVRRFLESITESPTIA
jgi:RNA-binding protein